MDWDFLKPVLAGQVRHLLTVVAGALVGTGALQSTETTEFVSIGSGIAMWALVAIWSWWQKYGQAKLVADLQGFRRPTPVSKPSATAVLAFLAIASAAFLALQSPASAQTKPTSATSKIPIATAQQNPLAVLKAFTATDLQAAITDANAQTPPDTVAAGCYTAVLALVNSNVANPLPTSPGVFQALQKARDAKAFLAQVQSPTGPLAGLNTACAPIVLDAQNTLIALGVGVGLVANPVGAPVALAGLPAGIAAFLALPKL